ncbi:MAG: glutamate racemase [Pseudomonadota bacterium]
MQIGRKIGIFDSGLGGIFIANAIRKILPQYDYLFLGDTLHLPYGRRSTENIYDLSEKAMRYMFDQGCELIIMACNTASATALRKLQQDFLVKEFPHKRILGVIVPTLEVAIEHGATRIGLLATQRTVHSSIYELELKKINPNVILFAVASPLLVPLIEYAGEKYLDMVLQDYLQPLQDEKVQSLILGCTHYVSIKDRINNLTGGNIDLLSQDDIIPTKLANYLQRHPEMEKRLSRGSSFIITATDLNEGFKNNIAQLMNRNMPYSILSN